MSLLTVEQMKLLLDLLKYETVAEDGRYRMVKRVNGYREGECGKIQAALSMMIEAKYRVSGRPA